MTMTFDEWLPDLRLQAPGARKITYERALRETLRDFCRRTRVWRREMPAISAECRTTVYLLPDGQTACCTDSKATGDLCADMVFCPDSVFCVDGTTSALRDPVPAAWEVVAVEGNDCLRYDINHGSLVINGESDIPAGTEVSLMPSLTGNVVGASVGRWAEAIRYGALARLFDMRRTSWFDPASAADFRRRYDTELRAAQASGGADGGGPGAGGIQQRARRQLTGYRGGHAYGWW